MSKKSTEKPTDLGHPRSVIGPHKSDKGLKSTRLYFNDRKNIIYAQFRAAIHPRPQYSPIVDFVIRSSNRFTTSTNSNWVEFAMTDAR